MGDRSSPAAVRATFERIAADFARTRSRPWSQVTDFLSRQPPMDRGLDLGCANGRHLPSMADTCRVVIGVDLSRSLLRRARKNCGRDVLLLEGEATSLPVRAGVIDVGIYIATIHHLSTERARVESLNELNRVLSPGAEVLISAWSVTHDRFDDIEAGEHLVPWTLPSGETVERFYYLYDIASLRREIESSELALNRVWEEDGNCWAVARAG